MVKDVFTAHEVLWLEKLSMVARAVIKLQGTIRAPYVNTASIIL